MRVHTPFKAAAAAAAAMLLATACGTGDGGGGDEGGDGGTLRAYISEPASLFPYGANDSESAQVMEEVYEGLTRVAIDGTVALAVAESIESEDNITWEVTLKEGYTFINDEPVDADAFIRGWNYAAYGPNAMDAAYFFSRIAGFDEVQADPPEAEELSGLTRTGDYSFTVELSGPFSGFREIVSYYAFSPIAQECLDDIDACTLQPISNGPYLVDELWEHDVRVSLAKNEDYLGDWPGNAEAIEFRIYESVDAAYAAFQGGELDMMDQVPAERLSEAQAQYPDGFFQTANNSFTYLGWPHYLPEYDNVDLRRAFSLAIDRQAIIDAALGGTQTPATGWVSPLFDGARDGVCEYCTYDPEEAQRLFDQAGGFDGTMVLTANAGADHETWMQALGDQLNQNLGIEYELNVDQQFAEYLDTLGAEEAEGPFRLGWGPDNPIMETYLTQLYATGSSSNFFGYSNPAFDDLLVQGDGAASIDEAISFYQQAEGILAEDMVVIPLWFGTQNVLYNPDVVDELAFNPVNYEDYGQTTLG
jgi:ABC-type oligopeptide transport system substrate-binding subunit